MKPGAVEKSAKNIGHLPFYNARPVIFQDYLELVLGHLLDLDIYIWQYACLLTGIQRVVHALLHGGDH